MGRRNYLIEGASGTGKTAVCHELRRRGYSAINGDRELAYQGDPATGEPRGDITGLAVHDHHLWRVADVEALTADGLEPVTFFCGGSRNAEQFIHLFDGVFVLQIDGATLTARLDQRAEDEWGGTPEQRDLIVRLHRTGVGLPSGGIVIDATVPITRVVEEILRLADPGAGPRTRLPGGAASRLRN